MKWEGGRRGGGEGMGRETWREWRERFGVESVHQGHSKLVR